jgi:hypothetical protein
MTIEIPTNEPLQLRAGDTWKWRREDFAADYPASSWALTYRFKNAAGGFEVVAAADGDQFAVTVAAATSAGYAAGKYAWVAWVESGAEEYTVDNGTLEVLVDLRAGLATAAVDGRSHARKMLDALEAALEGKATASQVDMIQYAIADRSVMRKPELLMEWRDKYRVEVRAEEAAERLANGLGGAGKLYARL